jgi:YVTN family beta-propeller protein
VNFIASKIQRKHLFPVVIGVLVLDSMIIILSFQVFGQEPPESVRSDLGINTIPVGKSSYLYPTGIAIDPTTKKVYVTNTDSSAVSVIDEKTDNVTTVGESPQGVAIDPDTKKVYVTNAFSDTVSVIDSETDKAVANIRFSISPSVNSGHIKCNEEDIPTNQYLLIEPYTQCKAEVNNGFQFSSWTQNLGHNSIRTISTATLSNSPINSLLGALGLQPKDNAAIFNVTQFGNFTANFQTVPPPIPPEYWIPLYGVVISSIVGWSIPSIIGWIKSKKQRKTVNQYLKRTNSLYNDGKVDENDIESLDRLKRDIADAYARGKISDQHYNLLNKKISDHENKQAYIDEKLSSSHDKKSNAMTSESQGGSIKTTK